MIHIKACDYCRQPIEPGTDFHSVMAIEYGLGKCRITRTGHLHTGCWEKIKKGE